MSCGVISGGREISKQMEKQKRIFRLAMLGSLAKA
jgi:hypothetical protein